MSNDERRAGGLPEAEETEPMIIAKNEPEPPIASQTPAEQPPGCQLCNRQKRSHRGPIGHRYLAPGVDPSTLKPMKSERAESNDVNDNLTSEPKSLKQMTLGILASIIDDAIRSMNTPSIPMIDDLHISPEFNIDRSAIIAAKVTVKFSVAGAIER
jgi:hypothetical protein